MWPASQSKRFGPPTSSDASLFSFLQQSGVLTWVLVSVDGSWASPPSELLRLLDPSRKTQAPKSFWDLLASRDQSEAAATLMNVAESQCPEVRHLRLRSGSSPHSPCKETQLIFAPPQTLPSEMQDILEDAAGWNREAPCPTTLCVLVLPKDGAGLTEKGLQQHKLTNLGALAAGIAHDLNNLFTGMGAFTHLLKGEIEDSKLLGYLETVEQTLDKSSKLTQSITNFLREDSSVIAPSDPVSCLRDILYIVRRTLQAGATLNVQLPPESYNIPVLRSELNQVFLNLLINARDALVDGGHISVEARFEPTERPKHFVLHIEDTGIGIPAENLGLIFEPFFSTKGEQGGTGLGLNVVQSIVQRAGGQISVHSAPGAGTSFFVRLPVANNPFPLNNSN